MVTLLLLTHSLGTIVWAYEGEGEVNFTSRNIYGAIGTSDHPI